MRSKVYIAYMTVESNLFEEVQKNTFISISVCSWLDKANIPIWAATVKAGHIHEQGATDYILEIIRKLFHTERWCYGTGKVLSIQLYTLFRMNPILSGSDNTRRKNDTRKKQDFLNSTMKKRLNVAEIEAMYIN